MRRIVHVVAAAAVAVLCSGSPLRASFTDPPTSFTTPPDTFTAQSPVGLAVADLDGDGRADVILGDAAAGGNLVRVRRNDGTGKAFDDEALATGGPPLVDLALGFLDAGTAPDFAIASGSSVVVGRNNGVVGGELTFLTSAPVDVDPQATIRRLVVADYDHDGFGDVIAAGEWFDGEGPKGFVAVLKGDGSTVALAQDGLEVVGDPVTALAAADLDGDAFPEILAGAETGTSCRVFANPGTGAVDLGFARQSFPSVPLHARSIAVGDVTGDGRPDAVVAGWEDYQSGQNRTAFTILRNDGAAPASLLYVTQITHSFPDGPDAGPFDCGVAIGDVDGEAGPEIVASAPLESAISVFHFGVVTDEGGAFLDLALGALRRFTGTGTPTAVALGSMNPSEDAALDVVTTNSTVNQSAVWFNALVVLEEPDDDGPPAGGDPLPAARGLALKVGGKPVRNAAFQAGKKTTFTCMQPVVAPGLKVRVQSTTTPLDEPSWEDVFGGEMTRGKGKKNGDTWTANVLHVPAGARYFRTVTSAPGYPDGIGDVAGGVSSPPVPADGYIGPYQVTPAGSVLLVSTRYASVGLGGERTFPGDRIICFITVKNEGTQGTGRLTVRTETPLDTDVQQIAPTAGLTRTPLAKNEKLEWELADLGAGDDADFGFIVQVTSRGNPNGVDWTISTSASAANKVRQVAEPAYGTKAFLPFASPLTLDVRALTPSPTVGGVLRYELVARNTGTTDFDKCVVSDRLPDGTAFDVAYFSDEAGDVVTNDEQWGDGRPNPAFDRATRKVHWLLGTLRAGETKRMRLDVAVQNDVLPGTTLTNGAFELRGCRAGDAGCSVLDLATLQAVSGEPYDVRVSTSLAPAPEEPVLRATQFALVPGEEGGIVVAGFGVVRPVLRGAEFAHQVLVENRGDSPARAVRLQGNLAQQVTFVPGSVKVTPTRPAGDASTPEFTLSSGGTLEVVLGDMAANTSLLVEYRARMRNDAEIRSIVTAPNWLVTTDSLSRGTFAAPASLSVLVAPTFVPEWHVTRDVREIEVGERITYTFALSNEGNSNGVGCEFAMGVPAGAVVSDDAGDPADGLQRLDDAGDVVAEFPVAEGAKSFTVPLGTVPPGSAGKVRVTFEYRKGKKGATDLASVATFRGDLSGPTKGRAGGVARLEAKGQVATAVVGAGRTKLVSWVVSDPVAFADGVHTYYLVVGNVGDEDAKNVVLTATAPQGSFRSGSQGPEYQPGAKDHGVDGTTWKLGTIPAHTAQVRSFRVAVPASSKAGVIVFDSVDVTCANAQVHLPPTMRNFVVRAGRTFTGFRWAATAEVLRGFGMTIEGADADRAEGIVTLVRPEKLSVVSNADAVQICDNGHYVSPLGGGNYLVVGFARVLPGAPADAHRTVPVDIFRGNITVGPGDTMDLPLVGTNSDFRTATSVADGAQDLVAAECANILVGVTGTLVNRRGTAQQMSSDAVATRPIAAVHTGNLIVTPNGIVAAGGGNIVAGGGGNIVAGGGGNLIGDGGGTIVAGGGGNIVAAGGGNIKPGAGKLIGSDAASIIGQDAASLIGDGGGTLIGDGGGTKR